MAGERCPNPYTHVGAAELDAFAARHRMHTNEFNNIYMRDLALRPFHAVDTNGGFGRVYYARRLSDGSSWGAQEQQQNLHIGALPALGGPPGPPAATLSPGPLSLRAAGIRVAVKKLKRNDSRAKHLWYHVSSGV